MNIASRFIWQLDLHTVVLYFAYIISQQGGENSGVLAGVPLPPFSLCMQFGAQIPFPFPLECLPFRLTKHQS